MDDRFVDRDMVMRYRGGGIGHKSTRRATDFFKNDRHPLDIEHPNGSDNDDDNDDNAERNNIEDASHLDPSHLHEDESDDYDSEGEQSQHSEDGQNEVGAGDSEQEQDWEEYNDEEEEEEERLGYSTL